MPHVNMPMEQNAVYDCQRELILSNVGNILIIISIGELKKSL